MATVNSETPDDFENKPGWSRHKYRGITYILHELPIGKFDEIQKLAMVKVEDDEGNNLGERRDDVLQMRMMLMACVVEPKGFSLDGLPSPVVFALNGNVNDLHKAEEDELDPKVAAKGKGGPASTEDGGEEKGKA